MRRTWLKILIALMLPALALSVYAREPDPEDSDGERYFESAYSSCLNRYRSSQLTRQESECVCDKLANYALDWHRSNHSGEPLPPAPQQLFTPCFE